jgi:hypothetical protein
MHEVLEKLKATQLAIRATIVNVNAGGCCVLAGIVGEELEKRGVPTEVIVDHPSWNPACCVDHARENVKNHLDVEEWQDNGISFNHVGLRFQLDGEWYTWDADAIWKDREKFGSALDLCWAAPGAFTVKEAKAFGKNGDQWNESFNRAQIPLMREVVKQVFEEA